VSIDPYLQDASGYRGEAETVLVPATVAELRETVRNCAATRTPMTIAGAGTGLTGARVPHGGAVISLERFRKLEIKAGRAICGAGLALEDLHQAAAQTRQFLGPNPTESSASIGGVVSTNAGGARSFRYKSLRYQVLGMEVTFADGRTEHYQRGDKVDFAHGVVEQPDTTKNSAGYYLKRDVDWVDLLAGSEGTLAIATEVELALFPSPPAILSGVVFFPAEENAFDAVDAWRGLSELRLLEFIDEASLKFLRQRYTEIPAAAKTALLVEQNLLSEDDPEVERWTERLGVWQALEDSWFGFRPAELARFREFRHTLAVLVTESVRRNGFPKCATDFAVPIARNRELHSYYRKRCEEEFSGQYTIFGHVGDANNHVNLLPRTPEDAVKTERLIYEFAEKVVSMGGTVAAEHGIGKTKIGLLRLMYGEAPIETMREVKRKLDPDWLLGRGNLFEVPQS
jgi:FAD/FMN-containing dehydrogenase